MVVRSKRPLMRCTDHSISTNPRWWSLISFSQRVSSNFSSYEDPLKMTFIDSCDINVSPDKRTILLHSEGNLIRALKVCTSKITAITTSLTLVFGRLLWKMRFPPRGRRMISTRLAEDYPDPSQRSRLRHRKNPKNILRPAGHLLMRQ